MTVDLAATLGPFVQHVWAHHAADPQLTEDAKEILLELFQVPKGLIAIYPTLSVTLHNVLYNPTKLPEMVDASMDLLRMVASTIYDAADSNTAQAQGLVHSLIQDLLPPLFSLLLAADTEDVVLRTAADCLAVLIRYTQCVTPAHLESSIKVVEKLIDYKSEPVQRRAGELVTRLIGSFAPQLTSVLPQLLLKVLQLLEKAKLSDTQQEMLLVFIRLINSQYDTRLVLDFLSSISMAGINGLSYPFLTSFIYIFHAFHLFD